MLHEVGHRLVKRLPEPTLRTLVLMRHGELSWQARLKKVSSAALTNGAGPSNLGAAPPGGRVGAEVVAEFDAHDVRRRNAQAVTGAFDQTGVAYVIVPGSRATPRRISVSAEDRQAALDALAAVLTGSEWAVAPLGKPRPSRARRRGRMPPRTAVQAAGRWPGIRVYRLLDSATGQPLAGAELACEVDFWQPVTRTDLPRPDGGAYTVNTRIAPFRNGVVGYLTAATWQAAVAAPGHWPAEAALPSVFDVRDPIDLVYTWVDGDDPVWLERKAAFSSDGSASGLNPSAVHDSRFASRDELRYSLRSVAMYASWARRIFIVTDGQLPVWLDTAHPKIEVVDHKQIFADPNALPVFNSHAIESQLHHIAGLSERYLYLNDDVFFGRPVEPELFFHANGISKFFLSPNTLDIDPPSRADNPVMSAAKRNRALIEGQFGVSVAHKFQHTPQPQLKSVLAEMEHRHPEVFSRVARSRFRHPADVSIPSALHHYYAYCLGRAVPANIAYVYQDVALPNTERRLADMLRTRRADVFCLNDLESEEDAVAGQRAVLTHFLEQQFPVPSPFEHSQEQHPAH